MTRISNALGIARKVLEQNHPNAQIKVAESGPCDFRISSVGASITITENTDEHITTTDKNEISNRGGREIQGRQLKFIKKDGDTFWFELQS